MRCTVLIENTAPAQLCCEHGLSFHLEVAGQSILLDGGSSGAFAQNALTLGVDLGRVAWGALSHGHYDHADGLRAFFQCNDHAPIYVRAGAGDAYFSRSSGTPKFVGIHRDLWQEHADRFLPLSGPFSPAQGVWLLPETVRGGPFASREPNLLRKDGPDRFSPDDFSHEQSLVVEGTQGLVIFNSCCHGGAVNIVRGVLDQLPGRRVHALVGGLHMLSPGQNALNCRPDYVLQVADALTALGVERLYTGHCTGDAAFALLRQRLGDRLQPLTTGLSIPL